MKVVTGAVILCWLLLAFAVNTSLQNESETANPVEDVPNIRKMTLKELRGALKERGVTCEGCVEKEHFVEALQRNWDVPRVTETKPQHPEPSADKDLNYEEVMKLFQQENDKKKQTMEKLREMGINVDNINFGNGFNPDLFNKRREHASKPSKPRAADEHEEKVEL